MLISFGQKKPSIVWYIGQRGVFELQYIHETQTHLKIKCSPTEAQDRITQGDDVARILQFLMRNYEEIFRKKKKLIWDRSLTS